MLRSTLLLCACFALLALAQASVFEQPSFNSRQNENESAKLRVRRSKKSGKVSKKAGKVGKKAGTVGKKAGTVGKKAGTVGKKAGGVVTPAPPSPSPPPPSPRVCLSSCSSDDQCASASNGRCPSCRVNSAAPFFGRVCQPRVACGQRCTSNAACAAFDISTGCSTCVFSGGNVGTCGKLATCGDRCTSDQACLEGGSSCAKCDYLRGVCVPRVAPPPPCATTKAATTKAGKANKSGKGGKSGKSGKRCPKVPKHECVADCAALGLRGKKKIDSDTGCVKCVCKK